MTQSSTWTQEEPRADGPVPPGSRGRGADDGWPQLAGYLEAACFPARFDDLIALLLRQHAPSRLICRLSGLPRTRQYASLDELQAALAERADTPG